MITLDLSHAKLNESPSVWKDKVAEINTELVNGTCKGNDFIGWMTWYEDYDKDEFARILAAAKKIQETSDVLVVCGIGGSYLGPRAAIEMVNGLYPLNQKVEVIYTGNTFFNVYQPDHGLH